LQGLMARRGPARRPRRPTTVLRGEVTATASSRAWEPSAGPGRVAGRSSPPRRLCGTGTSSPSGLAWRERATGTGRGAWACRGWSVGLGGDVLSTSSHIGRGERREGKEGWHAVLQRRPEVSESHLPAPNTHFPPSLSVVTHQLKGPRPTRAG